MTNFELAIIAVIILGFAVPAWLGAFALLRASARQAQVAPQNTEPNKRYFAYVELLKSLHAQLDPKLKMRNGPLFAATVRELANYPEYRTLSVLLLEEISVTGSRKFDQVVRAEMKAVEEDLLELEEAR
ncbi:hypothetical protein [Erythrobacter sp.]|uniref:hypothetical protein n=1 Tax=Erythrobacter sp. TaxID=1042 RepID=UPI002EB00A57|nr:hypothetical protein [Erythrobacter sp.]